MTYRRRTDNTHAPIRDALRDIGASVLDTHTLGDSFPDLVVGYRGKTYLVECKTLQPTSGPYHCGTHGESDGQRKKREMWRGAHWLVVHSPTEAIEWISRVSP